METGENTTIQVKCFHSLKWWWQEHTGFITCFVQSCQKVAHWIQIETKLAKTVKWFSSSQNCFVLFTSLPFAVRWTCPIPSIVFFVLISSVKSFFLFATHRFFAYQLSLSWSSQQSPKNLVGASALPTGKFLRVRKVFARIYKITHKM